MAHLTIRCNSDEMMAVICGCCSNKWPEGKAWKIWAAFTDRCHPEDQMTEVEFNLELAKLTLKENDEPRKLFEILATINARYGNKADEGRLMTQVHIATPQRYQKALFKSRTKLNRFTLLLRKSTKKPNQKQNKTQYIHQLEVPQFCPN